MANFDNLIAGAAAGVLVTAIFHPLDVAELQLQSQQVKGATVRDALRATVRAGGVPALFTAIRPALACAAVGYGVYFGCYGCIKSELAVAVGPDVPAVVPNMLAAATAGCITTLANNPLIVIKTHAILSLPVDLRGAKMNLLQASISSQHMGQHLAFTSAATQRHTVPSVAEVVRKIVRSNGLRGFYAGLTPSLAWNAEAALHMALYEAVKAVVCAPNAAMPSSTTYSILTAGSGIAKLVSATLAYPLAPVRTMLINRKEGAQKVGAITCAKQLYAVEGAKGFYRGLSASLAKQVVPMAFIFGLMEVIRDGFAATRSLIYEEQIRF